MNHIRMMLDSGAYSAWSKGKQIHLRNYIDFIKANHLRFRCYVNLDVIAGRPGHRPSPKALEAAAEKGWKNFLRMRKAGLEPIVVYHFGERRYWLEKMIGEGCKYIGLGGVAVMPRTVRTPWLDDVFGFLWKTGECGIKLHGFGITSTDLVHRYPWYSTDSVTWKRFTAYGLVLMPQWDNRFDKWNYRCIPHQFFLKEMNGNAKASLARFRVEHLGPAQRELVDRYLFHSGFTQEQVNTKKIVLNQLNSRYFLRSADEHDTRMFVPLASLFNPAAVTIQPIPTRWKFRMYLAGDEKDKALNREDCKFRLLSYYQLAGKAAVIV